MLLVASIEVDPSLFLWSLGRASSLRRLQSSNERFRQLFKILNSHLSKTFLNRNWLLKEIIFQIFHLIDRVELWRTGYRVLLMNTLCGITLSAICVRAGLSQAVNPFERSRPSKELSALTLSCEGSNFAAEMNAWLAIIQIEFKIPIEVVCKIWRLQPCWLDLKLW